MQTTWAEVDEQLEKIHHYLSKKPPHWYEAKALRDVVFNADLPGGGFKRAPEGQPRPAVDPDIAALHGHLADLKAALIQKDEKSAVDTLAEARKVVDRLRRRQG